MPAEAKALRVAAARIEACPSTHAGIAAVRADDPARPDVFEAADALAPEEAHAGIPGTIQKERVQHCASQPNAAAVRERGFGNPLSVAESNASERARRGAIERHADRARGSDTVGHNTLAASFVDGRPGRIGYSDVEPAPARCNRSGQAGRSAADYEDIRGSRHEAPAEHYDSRGANSGL